MPSLFAFFRRRARVAPNSPKRNSPKRNSPKRKSVRRTSPNVKRSGALGHNWYGGRNYINPKGPLRRALAM